MKAAQPMSDKIRETIALKAYYLWEAEGRPEGKEAEHWAQAEAEILGRKAPKKAVANKTAAKPLAAEAAAPALEATSAPLAKPETPAKKAPAKKASAAKTVKKADGAAKPAAKKTAKPKSGKGERA